MAEDLNINLDQTKESNSPNIGELPVEKIPGVLPNAGEPRAGGVEFTDADLKMPNIDTVQSLASEMVDTSNIGPIDEYTKNLIDLTSVDLDKYYGFTAPNNNINSPLPGKATNTFNPLEEEGKQFDLSTEEGRNNRMNQLLNNSIDSKGISPAPYSTPDIHFSTEVFQFDRFYNHPKYADLGFNLFSNNETLYKGASSKWDNFVRTQTAFNSNFWPAFNANWRSVRDFFGGKAFESDYIGAKAMMDGQRIGHSPSGGFRGWSNDLYLNSAYTMGILGSVAVEELAMWTAAYAAAPVTGTGSLWVKGADTVRKTASVIDKVKTIFDVKKYIASATSLLKTLENIQDSKGFYNTVRAAGKGTGSAFLNFVAPETVYAYKKLSTAAARGENITNLGKASVAFGGFYRDLRSINMALSESKMEGGIVDLELRTELYKKKKQALGRELTEEEKLQVAADAKQAGFKTLLLNAPIIYATNKLVLDGAIRGFRPIGEIMDNNLTGFFGRLRTNMPSAKEYAKKKAAGETMEIVYDTGEYMFFNNLIKAIKSGPKGTAKHMAGEALRYSTVNFSEGLQEVFQEGAAFGVKAYYEDIYNSAIMGDMEVQLAVIEDSYKAGKEKMMDLNVKDQFRGLIQNKDIFAKYAGKGMESQMSNEGFKVFMSGFAMGGLIQIPQAAMFKLMPTVLQYAKNPTQYKEYQENKKKFVAEVVKSANVVLNDPNNFFDQTRLNAAIQNILNKKMYSNSYAHNAREFKNDQDYAIFHSLKYSLKGNMMPLFIKQLESFKQLNDSDLKDAFSDRRANANKLRQKLDGMISRAKEMQKDYDKLPVNPHNRKKYDPSKDPINYRKETYNELGFDLTRDFMLFAKDGFRSTLKRANDIMVNLSENPVISKQDANDLRSLTSLRLLDKEIDLLEAEIAVPGETKKDIENRKQQQEKLDLLNQFKSILYDPKNRGKRDGFLKKNIGKLKPVFLKYLQNIAVKDGKKEFINYENIDNVLMEIVDHDYLNESAEMYNQAIDHLINPDTMFQIGERMSEVYRKTYESHANKNAIYLRVKSSIDRKERKLWLQTLAQKGITPDEQQLKEFMQTGKLPEVYYTEDAVITGDNPLTEDLWEDIQVISEGLQMEYNQNKAATGEDTLTQEDSVMPEDPFDLENLDTSKLEVPQSEVDGGKVSPQDESKLEHIARRQEFYDTHIPTQNLMKDIWEKQYKATYSQESDGPFLEYSEWKVNKAPNNRGGLGILNSRYELYNTWNEQSQSIKDQQNFEDFIISQNSKRIVNQILDKNGVSLYDVSVIKNEEKGLERLQGQVNKFLQVPIETKYEGIFILENIVNKGKKGEQGESFYEVVDANNVNLYDKAKFLDPKGEIIKEDYVGDNALKRAENAARVINKNIPVVPFVIDLPFGKGGSMITFSTGDIITRRGKKYINRTSKLTYNEKGGLYLVPLEFATELNFRKAKPAFIKSASQWQKGGYQMETEIQDKPLLEAAIGVKKLPMKDPIAFYGFDPGRVLFGEFKKKGAVKGNPAEIKEKFEKWITGITESEKQKLEILVEKNPYYSNFEAKKADPKSLTPYDPYNLTEGDENPNLKTGENEFEITLLDQNVPVAKLRNSGLVVLLDGKTIIDGTEITQEQAAKLFNIGNDENAYLTIRNRYTSLALLNKEIKKQLGNKNSVRIKLKDLKDVSLQTTPGYLLYKEDDGKTQAVSPYDKLEQKSYDGKIVIADLAQVWKNDQTTVNPRIITNAEISDEIKITSEIINTIRNNKRNQSAGLEDVGLGRYIQFVKSPDGTISYFKIKPETLNDAKIKNLIDTLKVRIAYTEQQNFTTNARGASVLKTKKQGLDLNINDVFNNNLQTKGDNAFYIENKPGIQITLGVNKQAQLILNYYEKYNSKQKRTIRANAYVTPLELKSVKTVDDFIQLLNYSFKNEQERLEKKVNAEGKRYTKINLKITKENFVNHISRDVSANELKNLVVPQIQSRIRDRQKMYMSFDNQAKKQAYQNRNLTEESETSGGTMTQTTPYGTKIGEVSLPDRIDISDERVESYLNDDLSVQEATQLEDQIISQYKEGKPFKEGSNEEFLWNSKLKDEFEQKTSQDGTNENITYVRLENEYKSKRKEKRKEYRSKFNKEYPNYTTAQKTELINDALKKDSELNEYKNRLNEIRKRTGLAKKIIRGGKEELDGLDIENINKFKNYLESVLPEDISVVDINTFKDNLIKSKYTPGLFAIELAKVSDKLKYVGKIYTSPEAPYKYHEAFHAVFRMFLTDEQIQKYLKQSVTAMKKDFKDKGISLNKELKEFQESSPLYEGITDRNELLALRAEEWLADEFETFKNNKSKSKAPSGIKGVFNKIIEFIKRIFERFTKSDIQLLFDKIDRGGFRNATVQEGNMFTQSVEFGNPQIALKLIRSGRTILSKPIIEKDGSVVNKEFDVVTYLPANVQNTLVSTISAIYINKVRNVEGQYNPDTLLDESISEYVELYNPNDDFFREMEENNTEKYDDIVDELEERYDILTDENNAVDIKSAVSEYLAFFDINISDRLEELNDPEFDIAGNVRTTDQYDKASDEVGGWKSLSSAIRKFIATTTIIKEDEFGRTVQEPVDFVEAYNGLLKAVTNTKNAKSILQKMALFANRNEQTRAVVQAMFNNIGITETLESVSTSNWNIPEHNGKPVVANAAFFQGIIKGFTQFKLDYLFAEIDSNSGVINLYPANRKDDANSQMDKWQNAYSVLYNHIATNKKNDEGVPMHTYATASWNSLFKELNKSTITNKLLEKKSVEISENIKNSTGIELNPGYIKYIIIDNLTGKLTDAQVTYLNAFSVREEVNRTDIDEIIRALGNIDSKTKKANPVLFDKVTDTELTETGIGEVSDRSLGVISRLHKLARGNANFDETVGTTVFRNPEGKLIYAHQMPSFHMEKVESLNTSEEIQKLKEDPYYKNNYLLNDPKFNDLAQKGLLRIVRISGYKHVILKTTEDGDYVASKALNSNAPGITFGNATARDVVSLMINSYFSNYNPATGKIKKEILIDSNNDVSQYTTAPIDIRVIEATSTGDFINLPVNKAVVKDEGNTSVITEEYIDNMMKEGQTGYETIQEEYSKRIVKGKFKPGTIEGYNKEEKGKWNRLGKERELFLQRTKTTVIRKAKESPKLSKVQINNIVDLNSNLILLEKINVQPGNTISAPIKEGKKNLGTYTFTNKGKFTAQQYSLDFLLKGFGDAVSEIKGNQKYTIKIKQGTYYTNDGSIARFLKGFDTKTKKPASFYVIETEALNELEVSEVNEPKVYKVNDSIPVELEQKAKEINPDTITDENPEGRLYTWDEAVDIIGRDKIRNIVENRLELFFDEFLNTISDLNVNDLLNKAIITELETSEGIINEDTKKAMSDLFLEPNMYEHNLKQIFFNDYLNTKSFNQILLGNTSLTLKDAVDEIKRAKMQTASGPSADSSITSPYEYNESGEVIKGHGVDHLVDNISMVPFVDPQRKDGSEKTDGQMYITLKAFKYMWFGFGLSSRAMDGMLRKIERGEAISLEEYFGDASKGLKGYKQLGAILNSKKFVYGDGKTYLKMSAIVLTPELTSYKDENGVSKHIPGRKELHNLRLNLEKIENEPGAETLGIGVPVSASKMFKDNTLSSENVSSVDFNLSDNVTDLKAQYMRLQQINPSNKNEKVDPRQIKNLISNEQLDEAIINIAGIELPIGYVRSLYHKNSSDRFLNKYFAKRNLIWNFKDVQNELQKSIDLKQATPDLTAFKDYALSALEASQSKAQMYDIFEGDYELNSPMTWRQYQRLFLSFFTKDVFQEREAGHTISLVSDWGLKPMKEVLELDENGQPKRWRVVRLDEWMQNKPEVIEDYDDSINRTFRKGRLKVGDIVADELKHNVMEYNEDGTPTGERYSEFMLPAHFAEMMNIKIGDPIPDVLAKSFAVRIPSQDKHSAVNLKLVGFLPVYYGSSGMFAEEMVANSGADFDIDKIYSQIKEWYYSKKDGFVEYGNGIIDPTTGKGINNKSEETLFKEYKRWSNDQARKKGSSIHLAIKKWATKNNQELEEFKVIKESIDVEVEWNDWVNTTVLPPNITPKESRIKFAEEKNYPYNKETGDFKNVVKRVTMTNEMVEAGLREIGLPVTKNEYIQYKQNHKREPYTAAQSNIILDTKRMLQGNDQMMREDNDGNQIGIANDPAVIDPLIDVLNWMKNEIPEIAESLTEEGIDVDNILGKLKAWANNHEGADNIGAAVQPNLALSILSEFKVEIRNKQGIGQIELDGVLYNKFNTAYSEGVKGEEQRTQFVISALITAMTDNAKERLAAYMGLNRDALAIVANMTALGVPIKDSILLVNHPTIKQIYFEASDVTEMKGVGSILEDKIDEFDTAVVDSAKRSQLDSEDLKNQISSWKYQEGIKKLIDEVDDTQRLNLESVEYKVLELFKNARSIKQYTGYVTNFLTLSAGLGENTTKFNQRNEGFKELGMFMTEKQFDESLIPIDVRGIFKGNAFKTDSTFKGETWDVVSFQSDIYKAYSELEKLLPTVFVHETDTFNKLTNLIINNLDRFKLNGEKDIIKFKGSILSFLTGKAYVKHLMKTGQGAKLNSLQNGLIYDQFSTGRLTIKDVMKQLKELAPENYFVNKFLFTKLTNNKLNNSGINEVIANTWTKLSNAQVIEIQREIVDLFTNQDTRSHIEDLVNYLLVKDGLQFAPNSFLQVIPIQLLDEVMTSIQPVHNLFKSKTIKNQDYVDIFGYGFEELVNDVTDSILKSTKNTFYLKQFSNKFVNVGKLKTYKGETSIDKLIKAKDSNLDKQITIVEALENEEIRGVATNNKLANKVGNIIIIGENDTQFVVKEITRLNKFNAKKKGFIKKWTSLTGYTEDYYNERFGNDDNVKIGSYLTVLQKLKKPKTIESILNLDVAFWDSSKEEFHITMFPKAGWKVGGKRGRNKGNYNIKQKELDRKIKKLERLGVEFITVERRIGGRMRKILLMNVPKFRTVKIGNEYIALELDSVEVPEGLSSDSLYDFENYPNGEILGFAARYKRFDPEGSLSQFDGGGFAGPRSSKSFISEMLQERQNEEFASTYGEDPNFKDLDTSDDKLEKALEKISEENLTLTEKGYETKDGNPVDVKNVESSKPLLENDLTFDNLDTTNLEKYKVDTEPGLKTEATLNADQVDNAVTGELIQFWNELSFEIKERLATSVNDGGYSVRTQEDFVALYNEPNMQFDTLDEFKEYINNCLK